MKISYNWLCQYLPTVIPAEKVSQILTSVGLEVEEMITTGGINVGLEGLIVGKIIHIEKHPNADSLNLTRVFTGTEELTIVCGAKNAALNQKVVVAPVGTTLYPLGGEPFKIKKAKIRGAESFGMLCAADEIGLNADHTGIIELPQGTNEGTPVKDILLPQQDTVFEIGITPDRSDAMSHIGVARDIIAYLNSHTAEKLQLIKPSSSFIANGVSPIKVIVNEGCKRYSGIFIKNVTVTQSPQWMQDRLNAIGVSPINNIVDITNYILHEFGQPLHAFDADKISGNIIVKTLPENTLFKTLDGKERKLNSFDLMICDEQKPLCIAGVYGGENSGITNETKNVFLESACFNADYIRKTSMAHGLRTDAAIRYEKGANPEITIEAVKRFLELLGENGSAEGEIIDLSTGNNEKTIISFATSFISDVSGKNYSSGMIDTILNSLEYEILQHDENITVAVPFSKPSIKIPADIAHEIMRIDGLDEIEIPKIISIAPSKEENEKKEFLKEKIANLLTAIGFNEIFTNSIANSKLYTNQNALVKMINNLSAELDVLRPSMLHSMLQSVAYNVNRKNSDIKFYEFGKSYSFSAKRFSEIPHLSILISGKTEGDRENKSKNFDLYNLKGIIALISSATGISMQFEKTENEDFDIAFNIYSGKNVIGVMGKISALAAKKHDLKANVFYADILWENLVGLYSQELVYKEISKFPKAERDLSIVIDKQISFDAVEKTTANCGIKNLESVKLFDVFESEKLGKNKKALALNYVFANDASTLKDSEIEQMMNTLMNAYILELNAEIRK